MTEQEPQISTPSEESKAVGNIVEPRVRPVRNGFLALSPVGVWPRIGVSGETEEVARANFLRSFAQWQELLAAASGQPVVACT